MSSSTHHQYYSNLSLKAKHPGAAAQCCLIPDILPLLGTTLLLATNSTNPDPGVPLPLLSLQKNNITIAVICLFNIIADATQPRWTPVWIL